MARPSKILTKEDILRAQKMTRSNFAAARYLHVSYNHYKKYAKMYKNEDGKTSPMDVKVGDIVLFGKVSFIFYLRGNKIPSNFIENFLIDSCSRKISLIGFSIEK